MFFQYNCFMKFVDRSKIYIKSGKGGDGKVSFRREKYVEFGGPDGGDGGKGGAIIFHVNKDKETLFDFSKNVHFKAEDGESGGSANCYGKSGEDLIIDIPLGTQIYDDSCELLYYDAVKEGDKYVFFAASKGGLGNTRFATSTNQAPKEKTLGEESKEAWIRLVLKIFCDYGFVGLPNAGKSSLLKLLTNSGTKVADYPFTTLKPELGALWKNDKKLILADLPGLINGASKNKGLGYQFLGHVERCKGIIHIVDISLKNSLDNLEVLLFEMSEFSKDLISKKHIVVLNKIDLLSKEEAAQEYSSIKNNFNILYNKFGLNQDLKIFLISAKNNIGIAGLVEELYL